MTMAEKTETRFCVDCKWVRPKTGLLGGKHYLCGHPYMANQVTGEPSMLCERARDLRAYCAESGEHYEPAH